jgi:hypothetical protein
MFDLVGGPLGMLCLLGEETGTGRRCPGSGAEPLRPVVTGSIMGGGRKSRELSTSRRNRNVERRAESMFAAVV